MAVSDKLDTLAQANLVRALDEDKSTYLFKHILVQNAAHALLLLNDRRELHRRVLALFESYYADQLDEHADMLAFHCVEAGAHAQAVQYFILAGEHAARAGAYPEAIAAFTQALKSAGANSAQRDRGVAASEVDRTALLIRRGDIHCRYSHYPEARADLYAALTLARSSGDAGAASAALSGISRVAGQQGDHAEAREVGEQALESARRAGDPPVTARALRQLGIAYNNQGDRGPAERALLEALAIYRQLDDGEGIANCLNSLGIVALERNDLTAATGYIEEALTLSRELGDRYSISVRLLNLGVIAEKQGDLAAAKDYQQQALAISQEIDDQEGVALGYLNLGALAQDGGDLDAADQLLSQALKLACALGLQALALYIVAAQARLVRGRGKLQRAVELFALAMEHPSSTADIRADFGASVEELRAELPPAEYEEAWARGRAIDLATLDVVRALPAEVERGALPAHPGVRR